jgi:hypothetical protein
MIKIIQMSQGGDFWSLIMLALMAATFLLVVWVAIKWLFIFL